MMYRFAIWEPQLSDHFSLQFVSYWQFGLLTIFGTFILPFKPSNSLSLVCLYNEKAFSNSFYYAFPVRKHIKHKSHTNAIIIIIHPKNFRKRKREPCVQKTQPNALLSILSAFHVWKNDALPLHYTHNTTHRFDFWNML